VYRAYDTIEGCYVALKLPHGQMVSDDVLEGFRAEVRLTARLDHPNVLPIKDASIIDGHFVIAVPLGESTLADRLRRRLSTQTALDYARQILAGLAHAHEHRILHCDIKPENLILFPDHRLRLSDFGIARLAIRTLQGSGSGTLGYMAPEQAMGKPTLRSDVFSVGIVIYRMLSGALPEWPYEWPPPGYERLRRRVHCDLVDLLERAISVEPARRFADAGAMLARFEKIQHRAVRARIASPIRSSSRSQHWRTVRYKQFRKEFGKQLKCNAECPRCDGPIAESMLMCPWCGRDQKRYVGETDFPQVCPRCNRGLKLDWSYCPWCYGSGFEASTREYSDKRYVAKCDNAACPRHSLMRFMRYCPWCRRRVRKKWRIPGARTRCASCGWSVLADYWSYCPWCCKPLKRPG